MGVDHANFVTGTREIIHKSRGNASASVRRAICQSYYWDAL